MAHQRGVVYGYIMDLMHVVKYAIDRRPGYRDYIETRPFNNWESVVLGFTVDRIAKKADISELSYKVIWIGGGYCACAWALPTHFRPENINEQDKKRLNSLKVLLGEPDLEPTFYFECDESDEEPEGLRNDTPPQDVLNLSLEVVVEAFEKDAEAVLRNMYKESAVDTKE